MKFKSEKGFTGTDITVALIIILLFMSLISVIFFNITKSSKNIDRKSEATYIATNIIENIKIKKYDEIGITEGEVRLENQGGEIIYSGKEKNVSLGNDIELEDGYTCYIKVENYVPQATDGKDKEQNDLVKVVTVKVQYKLGGENKDVELTTTLVREV